MVRKLDYQLSSGSSRAKTIGSIAFFTSIFFMTLAWTATIFAGHLPDLIAYFGFNRNLGYSLASRLMMFLSLASILLAVLGRRLNPSLSLPSRFVLYGSLITLLLSFFPLA